MISDEIWEVETVAVIYSWCKLASHLWLCLPTSQSGVHIIDQWCMLQMQSCRDCLTSNRDIQLWQFIFSGAVIQCGHMVYSSQKAE
jgi:hypothetical protein